jgi:hypothetical protein
MAKNKKLKQKLKQKQKQKQNQTVIVKVDNSRKTIRKGDTQPKQPRPITQPIIIQQPSIINPALYQQMTPKQNIPNNQPTQQNRNNVDDAINAFSRTNEERFNNLQTQLQGMNDNFRRASMEMMDRIDSSNNTSRFNPPSSPIYDESLFSPPDEERPIRQAKRSSTTIPPPSKIIDVKVEEPQQPIVSSTPSKAVQQIKRFQSDIKVINTNGYGATTVIKRDRIPNNEDNLFSRPKLLPLDHTKAEPQGDQISRALTYASPLPPIRATIEETESAIAEYLQGQMYQNNPDETVVESKEKQLELKKPDAEDKPPRNAQSDLMRGIYQNKVEEGICPLCAKQFQGKNAKNNAQAHMREHHIENPSKDFEGNDGKKYRNHLEVYTDKNGSRRRGTATYEQYPKDYVESIISDRNKEPLEKRNENNRAMAQSRKKDA